MGGAGSLVAEGLRPSGRFSRGRFALLFFGVHAISLALWTAATLGERARLFGHVAAFDWGVVVLLIGWLLVSLVLTVCAGIRRLHDLGRSGWFMALALVPLVNVVMILLLLLLPGKPAGSTKWDRSP